QDHRLAVVKISRERNAAAGFVFERGVEREFLIQMLIDADALERARNLHLEVGILHRNTLLHRRGLAWLSAGESSRERGDGESGIESLTHWKSHYLPSPPVLPSV